jgi:uncharacterized repeat protein (TIGR01451 family)
MAKYTFGRRMSTLGTLLGLSLTLPFTVGVGTAHAQAQLNITKTHRGDFARGGQGTYIITVTNTGDQPTNASMSDDLPTGLIVRPEGPIITSSSGTDIGPEHCLYNDEGFRCNSVTIAPGGSYTVEVTVLVLSDAPCSVTNTATVRGDDGSNASASDPTPTTGGECGTGGTGGGTGGSILPINLSGILPMFNNITTNNNIDSPGASNVSNQALHLNTPTQ